MKVARCEILDGASDMDFFLGGGAVVSSLRSPVMSLRIPVKAWGDFLSLSRRIHVHPVNVIRVISGCDCYLKPSDVQGRLALPRGIRLSWVPRFSSFLPSRVGILLHIRSRPLLSTCCLALYLPAILPE